MKHVNVMTAARPAKAERVAWVSLPNILGKAPLSQVQALWVVASFDHKFQK